MDLKPAMLETAGSPAATPRVEGTADEENREEVEDPPKIAK